MEMMACAQWLRSCPRHRRQRSLGRPSWKTTDGHHANAATHRTRDPSTGCAVQTWEDSFRLPDHKTSVLLSLYVFLKRRHLFCLRWEKWSISCQFGKETGAQQSHDTGGSCLNKGVARPHQDHYSKHFIPKDVAPSLNGDQ